MKCSAVSLTRLSCQSTNGPMGGDAKAKPNGAQHEQPQRIDRDDVSRGPTAGGAKHLKHGHDRREAGHARDNQTVPGSAGLVVIAFMRSSAVETT